MPGKWLSPGRTLQLPVGYVLVAVAGAILLMMLSYMLGHSRGKDAGRLVYEEDFSQGKLVAGGERPEDPLERGSRSGSTPDVSGSENASASSNQRDRSGSDGPNWGPVESDPRQEGLNYFVLAETRRAGALRLAKYCRARGLESYVISGNNPRNRRVIALPGFASGERNSPAVRAVEQLIHSIGDTWQHQEPGASNLRDAYSDLR